MEFRIRAIALAALLTASPLMAGGLEDRLGGTWELVSVEQRDAAGNWVARERAALGMLIYTIVGPLSGAGSESPGGDAASLPDTSGEASAGYLVMTLDDGRTRLVWRRGGE